MDDKTKAAIKRIQDLQFQIRKFEDYPQYARVPIYYGGDRQLHIMQPFDNKNAKEGPEPHDIHEWVKLVEEHGQIVVSFEALDDFVQALLEFRAARTGFPVHFTPGRSRRPPSCDCDHGTLYGDDPEKALVDLCTSLGCGCSNDKPDFGKSAK